MYSKLLFITLLSVHAFCAVDAQKTDVKTNKLESIHQEIPHYQNQPQYWLFVHSNDCSFSAKVDDMPVYTDFNSGSLKSVSLPINPLLLESGKHTLAVTLLPKIDDNYNLDTTLSKAYSVKIKIVRNENKKDSVLFEEEFKASPQEEPPLKEYLIPFDVEVPYKLSGWKNGVNLQAEDAKVLEQEVVNMYKSLMKDYETKNMSSVVDKYYKRQLENAESLYLDSPQDSKNLIAELQKDLNKKQAFKLEHYALQYFADGKVVALIRTDGEFRGKSAFIGLTEENFYLYNLLLYRPKQGAKLQVIR